MHSDNRKTSDNRKNRHMEPSDMMAAVTSSMRDRTGRTLEEWVEAVRTSGVDPLDQNEVRKWLKAEHGVPQNSQWAIAFETAEQSGWVEPTVEQYIDQQYSGPKAALRRSSMQPDV